MLAAGVIALALAGCTGPAGTEPSAEPSTPTPSAAPTQSPDSSSPPTLVVSAEGLTYAAEGDEQQASFDDAAAILDIVELVAGPLPTGIAVEPYDGLDLELTRYEWDDIVVTAGNDGFGSSLWLHSERVGETFVITTSGISVGSSRADAVAAGAFDDWDSDGDGIADYLGLEPRDVAGTESLSRPGSIGRVYVLLVMEGDVVSSIQAPGNDYADI